MPNKRTASEILNRYNQCVADRSNANNIYQELSEYVTPDRGDFTIKRGPGQRRDRRLFDNTPVQSNLLLASSMQTGLMSPFTKWFNMMIKERPRTASRGNFQQRPLADNHDVKEYLYSVNEVLFRIFNDAEMGFNQQNYQTIVDTCAYGTGALYVDASPEGRIQFNARHLSEVYIEENYTGRITTVYRKFEWDATKIFQRWGDEVLSDGMRQMLRHDSSQKFEIMHVVMPRIEFERMEGEPLPKPVQNFEYVSYYFLLEESKTLEIRGFQEFPFIIPRWDVLVGEVYGRGPGWNSLADIRMLNVMVEVMIRASQKVVDPPIMTADDGVVLPLQTFPGGIMVGGVSQDGRPLIQPFQTGANLSVNEAMIQTTRESIRRSFFVDTLVEPGNRPQQTATEVLDRRDLRFQSLGPQLSRFRSEYLDPLINRVFGLADRLGMLPEPPAVLEGRTLDIDYTSPLMRAQKSQEIGSLNQAIQNVGILLQADPTLLDIIDGDETMRSALENSGFPITKMRPQDEVDQIRQGRAQQQQVAQAEQATNVLSAGADAISKLGGA